MTSTPRTHAGAGRASAAVRNLQLGLHALFLVLFLIGCGFAIARVGREPAWVLPLAAAELVWYGLGAWFARLGGRVVGTVWVVLLAVLWLPLAAVSDAFTYLLLALALLALHLLGRVWGAVLTGLLTLYVVIVPAQPDAGTAPLRRLGHVVLALLAVGAAAGYQALLAESREKQRLVDELTAARDDLEALQDELARTQRESGALAERSRLARDIHDTLAQGFSSIVLLARAGQANAPSPLFDQIEQTAVDNLDEARRVVHALAPASLEAAPLPAALARLIARLREQTSIDARLTIEGAARPVPTSVEVALLRLAQGALANVRQHSGAGRCVVTLAYEPDAIALDVVDDGRGFDPAHVPASATGGGFGLRAMRERLADVGGSLDIESAPGDGTAVACRIPLKEAA